MPTTKDQRDIVVDTTESGSSVQTLTVNYVTELNNEFGGSIVFDDRAANDDTCDKTQREISLLDNAGTKVADVTVKLTVKPVNLNGFGGRSEVTSARETSSPAYSSGRVRLNGTADANYNRTWKAFVENSSGQRVIRNVVKLNVDWELADSRTYSISQSVQTQNDSTLALSYSITEGRETYASGTISMTAATNVSSGYSDGPIIVDDDDD